ncbi:MAG: helix-turn-helix domain-containing protein [Defluviitaleaceae bacterium]|nr:helix-turn-helix domain-containing protein [Defluviitaleaceae bacterium]
MGVGKRIQALRVGNDMSQEALAYSLGVTRQSVSKWELGQAMPDTDKIIQLTNIFKVSTDWLLLGKIPKPPSPTRAALRFGMYLIVKKFAQSANFYEQLLCIRASVVGHNRFAQFFFDGITMSIMNEQHLPGHDYTGCGDHKFVLNFWVPGLAAEHERLKALNIGRITEITRANASYYFFNVYDPDGNVIEITGGYSPE